MGFPLGRRLLAVSFLLMPLTGCRPAAPDSASPDAEEAAKEEEGGIINKKTQEVLSLEVALQEGAVPAATGIETNNPLLQNAAAYRTSVAKIGAMAVDKAIQLRNAQSIDRPQPLSYDQFMAEIIKPGQPDGIQLAELPYYQEYAWDATNQKLVVVDFPARKQARQAER
jgi:hypothetical protein